MDYIAKQTKMEGGKCYDQGVNKVMGEKEYRKEVVTEYRVTRLLEMGNSENVLWVLDPVY